MEKTLTVYGQRGLWKEIPALHNRIRSFVSHIKKNGFPLWYKAQAPISQMTMEESREEQERVSYERFVSHFNQD